MTIREVIFFAADFVVVLCEGPVIYYQRGELYTHKNAAGEDVRNQITTLLVKAEMLSQRPVTNLVQEDRDRYFRMLAWGYVAILEKQFVLAEATLLEASQLRMARTKEMARLLYLASAVSVFLLCFSLYAWITSFQGTDLVMGARAAIAGGLGALFFSLIRRGALALDGESIRIAHYAEGIVRVTVGLIGGFVALAAIQSKLVVGFLESGGTITPEMTESWRFLVCFAAGFSERWIPDIISKIDPATTEADPIVNASPSNAKPPAGKPTAKPVDSDNADDQNRGSD
jgi:hypothetical protein